MGVMIRRPTALALLAALALATAACSGTDAVSQTVKGSNGYQSGGGALTWVAPADRDRVEGVSGTLLDGSDFDLSSWRGHVVVVNFWGSWCTECRDETRALEQVHRDTSGKGVEFLGVNVREDRPQALAYNRAHHVTYPSLFDPSSLLGLRFRGVPPNATPTTLVLDRQGRIAARHSGTILYTQLRSLVDRVVAEPRS
jgi:thiol-disulfide isomerase/thioredoxin